MGIFAIGCTVEVFILLPASFGGGELQTFDVVPNSGPSSFNLSFISVLFLPTLLIHHFLPRWLPLDCLRSRHDFIGLRVRHLHTPYIMYLYFPWKLRDWVKRPGFFSTTTISFPVCWQYGTCQRSSRSKGKISRLVKGSRTTYQGKSWYLLASKNKKHKQGCQI